MSRKVLIAFSYCVLVHYGSATIIRTRVVQPQKDRKPFTLDDIFISVKTSSKFHTTRLPVILKTWFELANEQTWFFTDADSPNEQTITNGHMVNTNCPDGHGRRDLCCKTSAEYDYYMKSGKKWWCHFDDDNYVNIPRLIAILRKYNPDTDWYLGRTSYSRPVYILAEGKVHSVMFATFGAGLCISRSLALKMSSLIGGGKFTDQCEKIKRPDDTTMGYVIEVKMKVKLTELQEFHSHLEQQRHFSPDTFKDQISFGYEYNNIKVGSPISVLGYDVSTDPTRFLSLHCFLFPHYASCPSEIRIWELI